MKKVISILLTATMLIGLTGCVPDKKVNVRKADPTKAGEENEMTEESEQKKYVTDYDLELNDSKKDPSGEWNIWKRDDGDSGFLQIRHLSNNVEPRDYLLFWVFDSDEEAKEHYDYYYERSKAFSPTWEEGDNWFVSQEPDVCDAGIIWMLYLNGNVVIHAELDYWSEWGANWDEPVESTTTAATEPTFDKYSLKDYVIENADELKDFVLNEILAEV